MGSRSTTLDTRVVDWLGHSGASLREAVLEEIFILSLSSGRVISTEISLCSGVPQAVVSLNDWIFLKQPESQLDLCYNYGFSKKLEACDIHSDLSPQHRSCSYSYLQLSRDGGEPAESASGEPVHGIIYRRHRG